MRKTKIVTVTKSGFTAGRIAKYRPGTDVIAFTPSHQTNRQLALEWGVHPVYMEMMEQTSDVPEVRTWSSVKTHTGA